jgi:hypothetical protein
MIDVKLADNACVAMKLAYLITAHKQPRQLARLLNAIHHPGNTYVLHICSRASAEMHAVARDFAAQHRNCAIVPGERVIWGSWRLANAQRRQMAEALRAASDWDYCVNLSGQDYPLKTHDDIAAALAAGPPGANYLEVLDFENAGVNPRKRLEYYWAPWHGKMTKFFRRRPPKFKVYWGSNYFALTRAACEHLVNSDIARKMLRYFRFALCADEMIFQNAIMHGPQSLRDSIVSKTWRKMTWGGGSHPKTYTMADLDELLASDAWFARKFDETVDAKILDALDEHLQHRRAASAAVTQ